MVGGGALIVLATLAALLGIPPVSAQLPEDQPPSNLRLDGAVLTWNDNSANEVGFTLSVDFILGGDAPHVSFDLPPNTTSYDLAINPTICSGRFNFGIIARLPEGLLLPSGGLDTTVDVCSDVTPTATAQLAAATPTANVEARLPSTGEGSPHAPAPRITLAVAALGGVLLLAGAAALARRVL